MYKYTPKAQSIPCWRSVLSSGHYWAGFCPILTWRRRQPIL